MKLRSRMTKVSVSVAAMALSATMAIGVAQLIRTDDVIEKETKTVVENNTEESVSADIVAVEKDIVMAAPEEIGADADIVLDEVKTEENVAEEKASEFDGKFIVNVEEYLNVRAAADENADVVGKIYSGAGGTVIEKGEQWTKISSGNVEGYVSTQYLLFGEEARAVANTSGYLKATILEDSIRIRKGPSTEDGVWGIAEASEKHIVLDMDDSWIKINYDGLEGYVAKEYVSVDYDIPTGITIEEELEQIRIAEEQARLEAEAEEARKAEAEEAERRVESESKFVETVQTSSYDVVESDAYLLACLVCAEAGSEPYEGKLAVANVVLNRLNSGIYGSSLHDVIYAPHQFTVAASGRLASIMSSGPNAESVQAAEAALAGTNNVPDYVNFRSCSVANYSNYNNYSIIGSQVFFN